MILYFSGTGNTRYVAKSIANLTDDQSYFIPDHKAAELKMTGDRLVVCFPVYSWGVPPIVIDYIRQLSDEFIATLRSRDIPVVMVCTYGDDAARTEEMLSKVFAQRGVKVRGAWGITMPNVYVLLPGFDVDDPEVAQKKLDHSSTRIREIVMKITNGEWESDLVIGSMPWLKSRVVYPLYKKWGINPRRWLTSQECVGCGKCVEACPMQNIVMHSGRPKWGKNCVSCTSCYHHCPTDAICYGSITKGKGHYFCHLPPLKK